MKEGERFQRAFEDAAIGISLIAVEPLGQYLEVNPAFCRMTGYSREELLARDFQSITASEDLNKNLERVQTLLSGTAPSLQIEKRYIRKDGSTFWARLYVSLVRDPQGKPRYFIVQIEDIDDRKRAEEALKESEERYRTLVETASDAIITIDEESRILSINHAAEKIFGYSSIEMLGQPLTMLMPESLRQTHLAAVKQYTIISERHVSWESKERQGLHKSGKEIPLEISYGHFVQGGRHFFSGIVRNITRRKQMEEEIKTRAEQQTAVAELGQRALSGMDLPLLMDEAVCLIAQTLHIEYCKILELLPDGHALLLRAGVGWKEGLVGHATVGAKTDSQAGYTLLCKEPVIVEDLRTEIRFSGPPLLHDHGVVSGMSVIISGKERPFGVLGAHTTRQRSFTADDIHFLQTVANVLAEAIERKRLEEQLRHAQKLEAIGQLAGGVAHEFNNLLTAIIGNLNLAMKQLEPESDLRSTLTRAEQAAHRAALLTQQLLTFSRRSPLDLQPRNLGPIAEEVAHLLRQTIDRRIQVAVEPTQGLWPVLANGDQMHQVVMNLCVNARDALIERLAKDAGQNWQPLIAIKTDNIQMDEAYCRFRPDAKIGDYVCLSVSDNGCGMDEAIQHRLFEPFFTTKEVGRGTGLGLATVYGIVKQHEGWIELTSAKNEGTTFKIYLPRTQQLAVPIPPKTVEEAVAGGTETILFVDDEAPIRRLGQTVLEHHGYTVLLAKDGVEALEIFRHEHERIRLVVLDLTMPRQSGREVLQQLLMLDPKLKVIVSSGHDRTIGTNELKDLRAVEFFPKPYRPDELARAVRRVLDQPDPPD